ncbi:hypothetical protein CTA2_8222 [Colletotrichum tanaceti]|uniref:ATP synthase F0 n=1 Tax=Colletotrichum tanaceti TaxID=1306861 RepID=A0A4U6XJG6_9PEZI|nr:hypothetical protein CTA2_8222 [Colletotrichum tanaceti]TKW55562.1 hypothetical protein CTA1_8108 [Colletotrichum tanaceti]
MYLPTNTCGELLPRTFNVPSISHLPTPCFLLLPFKYYLRPSPTLLPLSNSCLLAKSFVQHHTEQRIGQPSITRCLPTEILDENIEESGSSSSKMPTATERINALNPFSKKEAHSVRSITTYKVLTILSWLLSLIVTLYYTVNEPRDGFTIRRRIWDQNYLYPTAFTLNSVIVDIYWIVLFILQVGYVAHLFSSNSDYVNAAASVGSHFIFNNLLHFAFVMLFVRSHFVWAELILLINFANLSSLYFRHNTYPRFIHWPVISAPLAWTFVAIYWNGAIMVPHPHSLVARIFGNIFIWSILVYGGFFIVAYKDYTIGFSLSALAAAIGVAQFHRQVIAFQWIFAFTIMAVLFVSTLVTAYPAATGKDYPWRSRSSAAPDAERAPLLAEEQ